MRNSLLDYIWLLAKHRAQDDLDAAKRHGHGRIIAEVVVPVDAISARQEPAVLPGDPLDQFPSGSRSTCRPEQSCKALMLLR